MNPVIKGHIKYLVIQQREDDTHRQHTIEIPESWKITYGPVLGEIKGGDVQRRGSTPVGNCLRVYETKDKQRMLIPNVVSFRDLSIPVMEIVDDKEVERALMSKETGEPIYLYEQRRNYNSLSVS